MPFKLTFLWTDLLFYGLILTTIAFICYAKTQEHLRAPWREVARNRLGVISGVILFFYGSIAFLDSIHYFPQETDILTGKTYYSSEMKSVFDKLVEPLGTVSEKTYIAPLQTKSHTRQLYQTASGELRHDFIQANYGKAYWEKHPDSLKNIVLLILKGFLKAILLQAIFLLILSLLFSPSLKTPWLFIWNLFFADEKGFRWRSAILTEFILLILFCVALNVADHYHLLGTDKVGEDIFYQALKSIRTGLLIGVLTTLFTLPFALLLGMLAGFFRGKVDSIIQYLYTTLGSVPGVLLISAAILALQVYMANHPNLFVSMADRADIRLLSLCFILGITGWVGLCRLLRAETMKIREMDYVLAARALGTSHTRILLRHILPNIFHIILISIALDFSMLVLAEAVLSYVGVGVDPSTYSFGNMINAARLELAREPIVYWPLFSAFMLMFFLVLSANLFADALRDAFDPRMRKLS